MGPNPGPDGDPPSGPPTRRSRREARAAERGEVFTDRPQSAAPDDWRMSGFWSVGAQEEDDESVADTFGGWLTEPERPSRTDRPARRPAIETYGALDDHPGRPSQRRDRGRDAGDEPFGRSGGPPGSPASVDSARPWWAPPGGGAGGGAGGSAPTPAAGPGPAWRPGNDQGGFGMFDAGPEPAGEPEPAPGPRESERAPAAYRDPDRDPARFAEPNPNAPQSPVPPMTMPPVAGAGDPLPRRQRGTQVYGSATYGGSGGGSGWSDGAPAGVDALTPPPGFGRPEPFGRPFDAFEAFTPPGEFDQVRSTGLPPAPAEPVSSPVSPPPPPPLPPLPPLPTAFPLDPPPLPEALPTSALPQLPSELSPPGQAFRPEVRPEPAPRLPAPQLPEVPPLPDVRDLGPAAMTVSSPPPMPPLPPMPAKPDLPGPMPTPADPGLPGFGSSSAANPLRELDEPPPSFADVLRPASGDGRGKNRAAKGKQPRRGGPPPTRANPRISPGAAARAAGAAGAAGAGAAGAAAAGAAAAGPAAQAGAAGAGGAAAAAAARGGRPDRDPRPEQNRSEPPNRAGDAFPDPRGETRAMPTSRRRPDSPPARANPVSRPPAGRRPNQGQPNQGQPNQGQPNQGGPQGRTERMPSGPGGARGPGGPGPHGGPGGDPRRPAPIPGPPPELAPMAPVNRAGRNLPAAIAVGVALAALALASLFTRPEAFVALVSFVVVLAVWELAGAMAANQVIVPVVPLAVGSLGMLVSAYVAGEEGLLVSFALTAFGVLLWRIIDGVGGAARDVTAGLFTAAYVPLLAGFAILMLRGGTDLEGPKRVAVFILVVVCSDIGGYAAGVLFGKTPMAPRVSPKKSWEGFAGSVAACVVVATACVVLVLDGPWYVGPALGAAMAVTATLGDLSESLIKRDLGVKDMGSLLPGHGGIMDRLDSLLPSAPIAFLILHWMSTL